MPSTKSWKRIEARHFGDDRVGVRIPGRDDLARDCTVSPSLDRDHRAVRDLVALALAAEVVDHADLARARHGDQWPFSWCTVFRLCKRSVPLLLISTELTAAARDAAPPMWNVRIVSCVPGSPIDCAAMTPTASPMLMRWPRARSRP